MIRYLCDTWHFCDYLYFLGVQCDPPNQILRAPSVYKELTVNELTLGTAFLRGNQLATTETDKLL